MEISRPGIRLLVLQVLRTAPSERVNRLEFGFTGRGLRQHSPVEKRFVHLDDLDDTPDCLQPRIWTYDKAKLHRSGNAGLEGDDMWRR